MNVSEDVMLQMRSTSLTVLVIMIEIIEHVVNRAGWERHQ